MFRTLPRQDALIPGTAGVPPAYSRKGLFAQLCRRDACGPRTDRRLVLLVLLICGVAWLAACNSNDPPTSVTRPPVPNAPPKTTFPMPPLNGGSINNLGWTTSDGQRSIFSNFKGKVLVLDFYATWCAPCRDSVPHLIGLQKRYEDQGLQVVGLNVGGPDDEKEVPAFAQEFGIQYLLAKPDDELVSFLLADSDAIPQTFVFDRQGRLVDRLIGFGQGSGERLDRAVEAALQTQAQ